MPGNTDPATTPIKITIKIHNFKNLSKKESFFEIELILYPH